MNLIRLFLLNLMLHDGPLSKEQLVLHLLKSLFKNIDNTAVVQLNAKAGNSCEDAISNT